MPAKITKVKLIIPKEFFYRKSNAIYYDQWSKYLDKCRKMQLPLNVSKTVSFIFPDFETYKEFHVNCLESLERKAMSFREAEEAFYNHFKLQIKIIHT